MILQKILFPDERICTEEKLYIRRKDCSYYNNVDDRIKNFCANTADDNEFQEWIIKSTFPCLKMDDLSGYFKKNLNDVLVNIKSEKETDVTAVVFSEEGQSVSLDTYFNSISIFKWKKYTNLQNLSVSLDVMGSFRVDVKNAVRINNKNHIETLESFEIVEGTRKKVNFDIDINSVNSGLIYIELVLTGEAGCFFGGEYVTEISEEDGDILSPVKMAVAVCTYKREKYIERNTDLLNSFLEKNKDSIVHGNLKFFIADNGNSLDVERLSNDTVSVFPNKNLGGSGGFGRAMYEILKVKNTDAYTRVLMMDDDVKFDPNVFERLFVFISLLKDEYKEAHIGGAMLMLDDMWLQSESGEFWRPRGHSALKYRYDLRDIKWLLKNEMEDTVDNFGWWFCCMPISVINEKNFPMPTFIKRDDIEFGLRNGKSFINLSGISVWHEAFDKKRVPYLDYYYYRNMFVLNARHRRNFDLARMLDFYDDFRSIIDNDVNLCRYKEAHVKMQGIDDFLKGVDWLKAQDAEVLNTTALKRWSYQLKPMEELNVFFQHGVYEANMNYKKTENSSLGKREVSVSYNDPNIDAVMEADRIIYYDENTQKGFVTERSITKSDSVYKHYEMTRKKIISDFERVRAEFYERYEELTGMDFWNEYLFGESTAEERPKEWWEDIVEFSDARRNNAIEKLNQYELEMELQKEKEENYPIIDNRVVFYLYQRRGFTCNIKYILQELKKETGDKLEIILVSDYPETCNKAKELGVKVVKAGTKEHWEYYFTAKVNITSDCQPSYFIKRDNQVAISAWHGGISYKVIGYDCLGPSTKEELEIFALKNKQPDYWLSGSQRFTDDTANGFRHDKDSFLPTGMARNDIFFKDQTDLVKRLKKELGISDDKKIALIAPTFRRGGKAAGSIFDLNKFKQVLTQKWGGDWEILYRGHYFIKDNPKLDAIDVSQYDDMQELLCLADVLVSDYSSCMWDYTFTGRPIFVYAPDLDAYEIDDRGFYIPVDEWPYPIATDSTGLYENILNFDEDDYREKIKEHHSKEGSFERGESAKNACKLIINACGI